MAKKSQLPQRTTVGNCGRSAGGYLRFIVLILLYNFYGCTTSLYVEKGVHITVQKYGHNHWDWREPDLRTELGIPVWIRDDVKLSRRHLINYIDAIQARLERMRIKAPRGRVVIYAPSTLYCDHVPSVKLSGQTWKSEMECRNHIRLVWHSLYEGCRSYAHERFHEAGYEHPKHKPWKKNSPIGKLVEKATKAGRPYLPIKPVGYGW